MGMGFGRVTTSEHAGRARRFLIINADGYGMTPGITRAIEQCIDFGTVRSLSANVNFTHAEALADLVRRQSDLSIGCHMNPVVGPPVLPPHRVGSLLGPDGNFWYRHFARKFLLGKIKTEELRCEMVAQVEKARDLAGAAFSHVDFHMGLHRLPVLYEIFLEVAERSGTGRIRTHRYRVGMESKDARLAVELVDAAMGPPLYTVLDEKAAELRAAGRKPYVWHPPRTVPLAAVSYVHAAAELVK